MYLYVQKKAEYVSNQGFKTNIKELLFNHEIISYEQYELQYEGSFA